MKISSITVLIVCFLPISLYGENNLNTNNQNNIAFPEFKQAFQMLKKKAEKGEAFDQEKLGYYYEYGFGVPIDINKALEWYQKAGERGNIKAQVSLGQIYKNGNGVPVDIIKAFEWYKKAAENGSLNAQNLLGVMYSNGEGVQKDIIKAIEWYQKAAEHGDYNAQYNLGLIYYEGKKVPKDMIKAIGLFQKAAALGDVSSQLKLGEMYATGENLPKDQIIAYAWLNIAAEHGYNEARIYLDKLEKKLSIAERSKGQQLANSCKFGQCVALMKIYTPINQVVVAPPIPKNINIQKTGTAFRINTEGYALTNHHVVEDCSEIKVAGHDGVATAIASDSVNDLALLQLPIKSDSFAKLNPDLNKLRQGEDVIVFGYPLNYLLSSGGNLTLGTLSALTGLGNNTNQIQITAPIQPGSSGSPVMDKKGNIVAMVSMMLDDTKMTKATGQVGQNVNFAVNGQTVKAFLDVNKVPYKTGGGFFSHEMNNADIADEARKWTVLVECWK